MRARSLLVSIALLMSCGGDDDSGSDPIDPGEDGLTYRETCQAIGDVICDKIAECTPPEPANCPTQFVTSCCTSVMDCDAVVPGTDATDHLNDCLDAFRDLSCSGVEAGQVPAECN